MTEVDHTLPDCINPNNFPAKLWRMVNNPTNSAICWDNSGEIVVIDEQLFQKLVLSPGSSNDVGNVDSFKTTHFSSIARQLNLYGFRKADSVSCRIHLKNDSYSSPEGKNTVHHFFNPNFRRNHPDLLVNMKRLTVDNKAKLDRGIDVRCRPPSKYQRVRFGEGESLEKFLMKGSPSSFGSAQKESPYLNLNRNLPLPPHTGSPVPQQHLPGGHVMPSSSVFPQDKGTHVSLGHPHSKVLSSPFQQSAQCGVSYSTPSFTGIHPQNEQYQPVFYSSVYQFCRPPFMAIPNGMQTGLFSPIGYYQARYPMMELSPDGQSPVLQNNNKQEMNKNDINLDTIFQIADELMQTQPNNNLTITVTPEKQSSSRTVSVSAKEDNHGNTPQNNILCTGVQTETLSGDATATPDSEAGVDSVLVQVPEEAISEDTKDDLNKTEVIQVEVNHTNGNESCQV